jgi:glycine betaine catabolism B
VNFESDDRQSSFLDYTAGQYAFFDIGGVYNDSKGPIRHFTISSSPTEDFVMITTRIRELEIHLTKRDFRH